MKYVFSNISLSSVKVLAHVNDGQQVVNVIYRDKKPRLCYKGHEVFSSDRQSSDRFSQVTNDLLVELYKDSPKVKIFKSTGKVPGAECLNKFLSDAPGALGKKKVEVLDISDDRNNIQRSLDHTFNAGEGLDIGCLVKNLGVFKRKIHSLSMMLLAIKQDALALARTKIIKQMWGSDKIQDIFDSLRENLANDDQWAKIDMYEELLNKSVSCLQVKFKGELLGQCKRESDVISEILIPEVINNYESIKKLLFKAVAVLSVLAHLDKIFKQHTSYPAFYFLDEALYESFDQEYNYLLKVLLEIPKIEEKVVYPLDVIRMQYLN